MIEEGGCTDIKKDSIQREHKRKKRELKSYREKDYIVSIDDEDDDGENDNDMNTSNAYLLNNHQTEAYNEKEDEERIQTTKQTVSDKNQHITQQKSFYSRLHQSPKFNDTSRRFCYSRRTTGCQLLSEYINGPVDEDGDDALVITGQDKDKNDDIVEFSSHDEEDFFSGCGCQEL
mmetsp:Transcript_30142/g.44407  ORF Transcript_30142/g.44407 Transcript_30142/m.44407 type:complete len:175 (+) Transcript_30142:2-526(+)